MLTKPDGSQIEQDLSSGKRLKCCYKAMYAKVTVEDSEARGFSGNLLYARHVHAAWSMSRGAPMSTPRMACGREISDG